MQEPERPIPPGALAGMEGWSAAVVWAHSREATTWRLVGPGGEARYLKSAPLGREPSLAAERDRMAWAAGRLPVPRVLAYGTDGAREWLVTAGLPGASAVDDALRADPPRLVPLLADGLRRLHALPAADCPFDSRAAVLTRLAEERLAAGRVDPGRDLKPEHGRLTAAGALARLAELRPGAEDPVVCHGDYCLPNVLIEGDRVVGYVDLGALGVADRWWDLAVATWSVTRNLGPGWEGLFLEAYGAAPDPRRQAFYRLLYDLCP